LAAGQLLKTFFVCDVTYICFLLFSVFFSPTVINQKSVNKDLT